MLKIEKLDLQSGRFENSELEVRDADLRVSEETHLKGTFDLEHAGTACVACVGVAATVAADVDDIDLDNHDAEHPKDIVLSLTATVVRTYDVPAGASTITTGFASYTAVTRVDGVSATVAKDGANVTVSSAAEAGKLTLRFTAVPIATGIATDDNINPAHTLTLDKGDVHIDMLCNVENPVGLKRNLTSFTVHGSSIHL